MQNSAALRADVQALEETGLADSVTTLLSPEPWNPVAAVFLSGLKLPSGITPHTISARIPIPDLYGFSASPVVIVMDSPLCEQSIREPARTVPFVSQMDASVLKQHGPFYVDLRVNAKVLLGKFSLCVTPRELAPTYVHMSLTDFLAEWLGTLSDPWAAVDEETAALRSAINTPEGLQAEGYLRLGHLYEGIRQFDAAVEVLEEGCIRYPGIRWLADKKRQVERLRAA